MDETAWHLGEHSSSVNLECREQGRGSLQAEKGESGGGGAGKTSPSSRSLGWRKKNVLRYRYVHIRVTSFTGAVSDSTNFHYPILFIDIMVINSTILVL